MFNKLNFVLRYLLKKEAVLVITDQGPKFLNKKKISSKNDKSKRLELRTSKARGFSGALAGIWEQYRGKLSVLMDNVCI